MTSAAAPPSHRVELRGGWTLWKWLILRSPGFPAAQVMRLGAPELEPAIDALLVAEEALAHAQREAIAVAERHLEGLAGDARKPVTRLLKRLRAKSPIGDLQIAALTTLLESVARVEASCTEARARVGDTLASAQHRVSSELRKVALDPLFREAVTWQNRTAIATALDVLARQPEGAADSKTRQKEMLVASYLQRYCVKNDTIGFFGPVGWGTLSPTGPALELRPGPSLIRNRRVSFEYWGIDALARLLAEQPEIRIQLLRPRRMPTIRVEGTTLHHPIDQTAELPPAYARLLAECDGVRHAEDIAETLLADAELELSDADDVYQMLTDLVDKGLATWTFEVPTDGADPDLALRRLLEELPDEASRTHGLAALDELTAARDAVARAAGDPGALDRALGELEATFSRLTGAAATRRPGMVYAGRTLVYEDCSRDLTIRFGPELIERLAPSLSLLLPIARWFTHRVAERYQVLLRDVYRGLRDKAGTSAIDYLRFFSEIAPLFSSFTSEESAGPCADIVSEMQARWAEIIGLDGKQANVQRSSEALRPLVEARFAAPQPGWPGARFHSPDIMLAARSVEAFNRGEYLFVLGELHPSLNTTMTPFFLEQHGSRQELVDAMAADIPDVRVGWVSARDFANRAALYSQVERDLHVESSSARSFRPREQVMAVGELVVEEIDGRLEVRSRDHRHRFDIIVFLEQSLSATASGFFKLAPTVPHAPRVTIDSLVISRESWRFSTADIPFVHAREAIDRLVGARRWTRAQGIPRFAFYKTTAEAKPCFVDFMSPHLVEEFAKLARNASAVSLSEMLPSFGESWLVDSTGQSFTSELRFAAVDPVPWRPSGATAGG